MSRRAGGSRSLAAGIYGSQEGNQRVLASHRAAKASRMNTSSGASRRLGASISRSATSAAQKVPGLDRLCEPSVCAALTPHRPPGGGRLGEFRPVASPSRSRNHSYPAGLRKSASRGLTRLACSSGTTLRRRARLRPQRLRRRRSALRRRVHEDGHCAQSAARVSGHRVLGARCQRGWPHHRS
jgi:hypothetical protein